MKNKKSYDKTELTFQPTLVYLHQIFPGLEVRTSITYLRRNVVNTTPLLVNYFYLLKKKHCCCILLTNRRTCFIIFRYLAFTTCEVLHFNLKWQVKSISFIYSPEDIEQEGKLYKLVPSSNILPAICRPATHPDLIWISWFFSTNLELSRFPDSTCENPGFLCCFEIG